MRQSIFISEDFFCDGHCYLLTSASLGGSDLTAQEMQDILFEKNNAQTTALLLEKGVCLPFCFPGDGALDGERDEYDEMDDEFDEDEDGERVLKVDAKYREYDGAAYIIRLVPAGGTTPPQMPELEGGWFQQFEFRAL